ncbi:MAG: hypothetical protein ABSE83_02565 [Methanobacterium sp.]
MNLSKNTIIIIISLFAIIGAFTFADSLSTVSADDNSTWVAFNTSNVGLGDLMATITVTIKNTASVPEYFKISQVYTGSITNGTINWTVNSTNPTAEYMIDNTNPGNSPTTTGDLGWQIAPGQTKTVSFVLHANGGMGEIPYYLTNENAVNNTYWPLIPDMGLSASWFDPDEIQTLNPNLQLESWCGTFTFGAVNGADYPVSGIIRGPVIPTDSNLIYSDPKAFLDTGSVAGTGVALWNVTLGPYDGAIDSSDSEFFKYTYKWPIPNKGPVFGTGSSVFAAAGNQTNNTTSTVPNQNTGIPMGLLGLAAAMVGAGVAYAKFLR